MLFVPVVVPPTVEDQPSPRTRELAGLLGRVIEEYERHHPSVSGSEVRMALRLAAQSSKSGGDKANVAALVAGLLAMFMAFGVFFLLRADAMPENIPWASVGIAVAASIFAVALIIKRISER